MPIYEYKCENCGEVFEVRQNYSDQPVTVHEKCGGKVEKLISAPSFNFKGSGWYVNDYGKGNNGAKKPDTETKSTADSTTKSDSATTAKSSETKTSDSSSSSTTTAKPAKTE
jgi:putative FmdB family regulatory protein